MKTHLISAIFALLFITIPLHLVCMNSMTVQAIDNNQYIIQTAPGDKALCGAFISNTKIIVASTKDYAAFIDFSAQTTKITPLPVYPRYIAVNADKSLCAVSEPYELTIYDTKTDTSYYNIKFEAPHDRPIAFCPKNPLHLFYRQSCSLKGITLPNNSNKSECYATEYLNSYVGNKSIARHFISHPIQEKSFLECGKVDHTSNAECYSYEHQLPNIITITKHMKASAVSAEYNSDGSLIAMMSDDHRIYLVKDNKAEPFDRANIYYIPYRGIKFHPNNIVLALLTADNAIEYWNCLTKEHLGTTNIDNDNTLYWINNINEAHSTQRMSISPNGTKILVALQNQYRILNIPFKAIFQGDTKKQSITALLSLQKYAQKYAKKNNLPDNAIPQDVINLILQIYWNCDYVPIK